MIPAVMLLLLLQLTEFSHVLHMVVLHIVFFIHASGILWFSNVVRFACLHIVFSYVCSIGGSSGCTVFVHIIVSCIFHIICTSIQHGFPNYVQLVGTFSCCCMFCVVDRCSLFHCVYEFSHVCTLWFCTCVFHTCEYHFVCSHALCFCGLHLVLSYVL